MSNAFAELIAAEEGTTPPAAAAPAAAPVPDTSATPLPEPVPAAPEPVAAAPATPEPAPQPQALDLSTLAPEVRALFEAEIGRRDADIRQREQDLRRAAGKIKRLETDVTLARRQPSVVPSAPSTPAPAVAPATGGAPAPSQTATTADLAAAVALTKDARWQRLVRDYPEFELMGSAVETLGKNLEEVAALARGGPDANLIQRLDQLDSAYRTLVEEQESARFREFEAVHQPANHVHVAIKTDEHGQRHHVVTPRSPEFAYFYLKLDEDTRASINWDDPADLTALFDDMKAMFQPQAQPAASTPAAPAAPSAPGDRARITVAAVPRAPNAGITRVSPNDPPGPRSTQQSLAALIAQEEGRTTT